MDKINGLNNILAILRKQIGGPARSKRKTEDLETKTDEKVDVATSSLELEELEKRLFDRIAALDPNDPDKQKNLTYLFVQTILTWEFGEKLLEDPGFHELVEKVSELFCSNTKLRNSLDEFLADKT